MLDYKKREKELIIKEALHKGDSTKVKLSANLIAKTGMNKEAMADTLASIISNWVKSKGFVNQSECIYNSKMYGRGRNGAIF
jgi:L-asparaginase II